MDNNYFEDSKDVLGTFYTDEAGYWQVGGNIFDNVTWSAPGSDNDPAGPNPKSNTTVSIPYSYSLDGGELRAGASSSQTAGANKGLQVSNGSCSPQTPTPTPTRPRPDPPTDPPTTTRPPGPTSASAPAPTAPARPSGTSYGNVRDGNLSTYWSPSGSTGDVSVKWSSAKTVVQRSSSVRRPAPPAASDPGSSSTATPAPS